MADVLSRAVLDDQRLYPWVNVEVFGAVTLVGAACFDTVAGDKVAVLSRDRYLLVVTDHVNLAAVQVLTHVTRASQRRCRHCQEQGDDYES
jgi:hypothetical protein